MENRHVFDTRLFNVKKRITMAETKKKINWLKIWQIVRDLLVAILTGDAIANKI